MSCYYFSIKGKERGELGNRTYCLAENVFFSLAVSLSSPSVLRVAVLLSISQPTAQPCIADGRSGFASSSPRGWTNPLPPQALGLAAYGHQPGRYTAADPVFNSQGSKMLQPEQNTASSQETTCPALRHRKYIRTQNICTGSDLGVLDLLLVSPIKSSYFLPIVFKETRVSPVEVWHLPANKKSSFAE